MNTKDIGDKSEAIIFCELVKRNFTVLKPWGDNRKYDFVVDIGKGVFQRIQSKTGYIENGVIRFTPRSVTTENGKTKTVSYSKDDIDFFMVYCRDNDKIYCISIEDCPKDTCFLRLEPSKNGQTKGIRMANDFELDKKITALSSHGRANA